MQTIPESECSGLKLSLLEEVKMDTLKKCYQNAKFADVPKFISGEFLLTPDHFKKESWLLRLNSGFLTAGANTLIEPICLCVLKRMQENEKPNHPYHILCYELLQWLTSNPDSNEAALKNLQARQVCIKYMLNMLFRRKKKEGEFTPELYKEEESTFLLLALVQSTLTEYIIPRLKREMSSTVSSLSKRCATTPTVIPQPALAEPTTTEPVIVKAMPVQQSPPTQRSPAPIYTQLPKLPPLSAALAATTVNNNPAPIVTDSSTTATTLATNPRPISPRLRHFLTEPVKHPQDKAIIDTRLNTGSERVRIPAPNEQNPDVPDEPKTRFNML